MDIFLPKHEQRQLEHFGSCLSSKSIMGKPQVSLNV